MFASVRKIQQRIPSLFLTMPRQPRLHFPGAVYHVIHRGNDRREIFFDNEDRHRFLLLCQEGCVRFHWRVHAYCLMENHCHLAVQVGTVPLSNIMQNISFRYTQYINKRYQRIGHLFHGRYKSILVDKDNYLLELIRYIHLNPVRAGIVERPEHYLWSSHREYCQEKSATWLTTDWGLSFFSNNADHAVKKYQDYVEKGIAEGSRKEFSCGTSEGRLLGDDTFIESALKRDKAQDAVKCSVGDIVSAVCQVYHIEECQLVSQSKSQPAATARAMAALLVRNARGLSLTEFANYLQRDLSSISQAARRLEMSLLAGKQPVSDMYKDALGRMQNCQA